ncbi:MAG: TetR/AcrR family transcriptional regulator [Planctomycetota bacterium]
MGTRERRERERTDRRNDILKAARKLFWKGSFEATSMAAIARESELAPGTLYLYFQSKEALYAELLIEGYDILIGRLENKLDSKAPPRKQAGALIEVFFKFAEDFPEYFDIIFFVLQRERMPVRDICISKDQLEELDSRQNACKGIVAEIIGKSGVTKAAVIDRKVEAIWSMLAGVVLYNKDEPDDFKSIAKEAKEIILKGFFG